MYCEGSLLRKTCVLLVFSLTIACVPASGAIDDFEPGYIVTNEQDTLKGFVSIKDHSYNTRTCVFKETEASPAVNYLPGQIAAYGVKGKYFRSFVRTTNESTEKIFMESIYRGSVSLYFWTDVFFIEHNSEIEELIEIHKEVSKNGKTYQITQPLFRITLQDAMTECATIFNDIASVTLTRRSLTELFERYYQCTGVPVTRTASNSGKGEVRLGVALGVSYAELHSNAGSDPNFTFLNQTSKPKTISVIPSVWIEFWNPSISRNLRLKLGLNYYNNTFNSYYVSGTQSYEFHLSAGVIEIPLQLKFSFTGRGMYASVGAAQAFSMSFDDKLTIKTYPGGAPVATATYLDPRGSSQFVFAIGYERQIGNRLMFIEANTRLMGIAGGADSATLTGTLIKGPTFDMRIFSLSLGYPLTRDK